MKLDKIDNKSRRIRKKLFLGEFAILGFEISCETDINDFDRYDAFVDDFIDYIDGLGLCFGGGLGGGVELEVAGEEGLGEAEGELDDLLVLGLGLADVMAVHLGRKLDEDLPRKFLDRIHGRRGGGFRGGGGGGDWPFDELAEALRRR